VQFHSKYFLAAVILFLIEVFIAAFVQDSFIRPYGGDFLVVVFLYCLLKSFFKLPVKKAILGVLLFTFAVEGSQYLKLVDLMGLQDNKIASARYGESF
jgi:glycopeptide antibiotics resistance protein